MAVASFLGRLLFASVFILSAGQEFIDYDTDGGLAAKYLEPKLRVFSKHIGFEVPKIETTAAVAVAAAIGMKYIGGLLFILGSFIGAFLLILHQLIFIPILYDYYNYDRSTKEFNQLSIQFRRVASFALLGALFFFVGMKNSMRNSIPRRQLKKKPHKKQL